MRVIVEMYENAVLERCELRAAVKELQAALVLAVAEILAWDTDGVRPDVLISADALDLASSIAALDLTWTKPGLTIGITYNQEDDDGEG